MKYFTFDDDGDFSGVSDTPTNRCTESAPPPMPAGYVANWNGISWGMRAASPVAKPQLSKRQFKARFTPQEWFDACALAQTDANAKFIWDDMFLADFVSTDDPDTILGVQFFRSVDVIKSDIRVPEILA
jgi:hypothetical protein